MSKKDELFCNNLGICACNRNVEKIYKVIKRIFEKSKTTNDSDCYTDEELVIIALLDSISGNDFITHGTNIEYPIFINYHFEKLINDYEKK